MACDRLANTSIAIQHPLNIFKFLGYANKFHCIIEHYFMIKISIPESILSPVNEVLPCKSRQLFATKTSPALRWNVLTNFSSLDISTNFG